MSRYRRQRSQRAGCKTSSLAGGRERGRPAGRGAVGRDQCFSGEHPVGLFADRTRLELILQRTQRFQLTSPTFRGRARLLAEANPCCGERGSQTIRIASAAGLLRRERVTFALRDAVDNLRLDCQPYLTPADDCREAVHSALVWRTTRGLRPLTVRASHPVPMPTKATARPC